MGDKARILVVDDDPEIISFLKRGLSFEGYQVDTAGDGAQALARARDGGADLVILDVMMPGMDGTEVISRLRQGSDVPILMLTARATVADRIAGLDSGADDYMVKPFAFDELLARVRALLRRRRPARGETLCCGDLWLNTATREVRRGNRNIELTAHEFDLLQLFMRYQGQVLRRERIFEEVWDADASRDSNLIEVYVRYLRSKLETPGDLPKLIHTVWGVGYVLKTPETSTASNSPLGEVIKRLPG